MSLSVTVLVPAHNEAEDIQAVLGAIAAQTYPVEQLLVMADACTDNTAELARAAGAVVMEVDCGRKADAQNLGLAAVTGDVVVGVDADTCLAPDAIELMVADLERGYDGTCAAVLPRQEQGLWVRARWYDYTLARRWTRPVQRQVGRMHVLSGACYAFRTEVMREAGGMRDVPAGEDTDLTWTLYGQGRRLTYTPEAVAYTSEPESFGVYFRQIRRWSASCFQTIARHRRQCAGPARALVVGTMLWDLLSFPIAYALVIWALLSNQSWGHLFGLWTVLVWGVPTVIVARDLGWRKALACLPAHIIAGAVNRVVYLTTMLREWVLGRHYASWTGRQGRRTVITPMTPLRRRVLGSAATNTVVAAGLAVIVALGATAAVRPETLRMPFVSSPVAPPPPVEEEAMLVSVDVEEELAPSTTTTTQALAPGPPQPEAGPASVPVMQSTPALSRFEPMPTRRSAVVPRRSRTVRSPRPGAPASTTTTTTVSEPTTTTVPADSGELEESTESPTSPATPPPPVVEGA